MNTTTGGGHFGLVVMGAGSGVGELDERFDGLKVAIVDKGVGPLRKYAGTCLNVGCVPTKMLVHTADTARAAQHGAQLGVDLELRGVDWTAAMDRLNRHIDPSSAWWLHDLLVTGLADVSDLVGLLRHGVPPSKCGPGQGTSGRDGTGPASGPRV
ncbi:hypothetical protein OG705_04420 [Streptomyces sp. NBC_00838]|uniref:hypothetical protein n=1 Tax=Streptomyces sp. NBC_00838 TaxID=2903680 RepID=UPI003864C870|nr:hypothetical protein OG705_04420 [Streptomyces sp. NBC_00838]